MMLVINRLSFLLAKLLEDLVEGIVLALQVGRDQLDIRSSNNSIDGIGQVH